MQESNPYTPSHPLETNAAIPKVQIRVFELLNQAYALISPQYWLFFGICLVGMLIASAVPMGLIMGPMMIGIYLCFLDAERGIPVEFSKLFKGFDQFGDALIATLILIGISIVVTIPAMIVLFMITLLPVIVISDGGEPNPVLFLLAIIGFYGGIIFVSILSMLPFLFTFQLMADRKLKAVDSIKLSFRGVWQNFWGVLKFLVTIWFISVLLMVLCYLPVFFFMPISFGAMFLLYRKIFPMLPPPEQHYQGAPYPYTPNPMGSSPMGSSPMGSGPTAPTPVDPYPAPPQNPNSYPQQ